MRCLSSLSGIVAQCVAYPLGDGKPLFYVKWGPIGGCVCACVARKSVQLRGCCAEGGGGRLLRSLLRRVLRSKKKPKKPKKTKKKTVVAELVAEGVAELVAEGVAEPLPIPYMHPRGGRGEGASWKVAGKRWVPPRFEASPSNYHTLGSPRPSIYIKALFFLLRHGIQVR